MGKLLRGCAGWPLGKLKQAASAAYFQAPAGGLVGGLFEAADYGLDQVEVWPENWRAWRLFADMATQWRVDMSVQFGLDYSALYRLLDEEELGRAEWRETFDDIRILETAALKQISANRSN